MRARDIMTSPVITVRAGTPVKEAAALLAARGFTAHATIAQDVRHKLELYGGPCRWRVDVHDGAVTIGDEFDDATDRHVATVLAEALPGVVWAHRECLAPL